ncbi:hypothetical protein BOX15_Mlig031338g3, partial [Macrostomum lignano]
VACALSGGVDSAVSAYLLRQRGFQVTCVHMTNWDELDETGHCSGERDLRDAQLVSKQLGLPFLRLNFTKEYWTRVFQHTLGEYESGRTPNPDVLCNRHIKFDCLYKYCIDELKFDALATGHYARTSFGDFLEHRQPGESVRLLCSADPVKDQTFWLCQVPQEALRRAAFPIGSLMKPDVKRLCSNIGLSSIATRRESAGICFIGKRNFSDFIDQYVERRPGRFVHLETGKELGQHDGVHHYTLGQRPRLAIDHRRYFVAKLCPNSRTVYLVDGVSHPSLYHRDMRCEPAHWIHSEPPELAATDQLHCQLRWQNKWRPIDCHLAKDGAGLRVTLAEPMRCVSAGQYAVFYRDNECLGSARILASRSLCDEGSRDPVHWNTDDFLATSKPAPSVSASGTGISVSEPSRDYKISLHYAVDKLCDSVATQQQCKFSPEVVAAIAESVHRLAQTYSLDLESFARHAKRSTVGIDDVRLCARRNPQLLRHLLTLGGGGGGGRRKKSRDNGGGDSAGGTGPMVLDEGTADSAVSAAEAASC